MTHPRLYIFCGSGYTSTVAETDRTKTRGKEGGIRQRLRDRPRLRPKVYGYLTEEKETLRQGFAALFVSSVGELVAGIVLAGIAGTLDELVGLAVLIPAAIGMRGAIFGAMGSRLSNCIRTGLFNWNLARGAHRDVRPPASRSSRACFWQSWLRCCAASSAWIGALVIDYISDLHGGWDHRGRATAGSTVLVARVSVARGRTWTTSPPRC